MFDPFGDFNTAGYLRNVMGEKDPDIIKHVEHDAFRANLPAAMAYLQATRRIGYGDFLRVHAILFGDFYPWAGQDRSVTAPNSAISKAGTRFCLPWDCQRAVEAGLRAAQDRQAMAAKPGHIMGLFAYGHPFLDGNGRTMLVVHNELCFRANMSIQWDKTSKNDYLTALSLEIENPNDGHLDGYLASFTGPQIPRPQWDAQLLALKGLNGAGTEGEPQMEGDLRDPRVAQAYKEFERRRGYDLDQAEV